MKLEALHSAEKLNSILKAAEQAEDLAKKIVLDEDFNIRKGWILDSENENVAVHYKDMEGHRYFAAKTKVPFPTVIGQSLNWNKVAEMADWNPNVKFSRLVGKIGEDTDLTHYASNEKFMVKSREFIVARRKFTLGDALIVAAKSCSSFLVEPTGKAVLANLYLGVGRYIPDEENIGHSRYDYIVSIDLKGMMPMYLVNQVMGKMVLSDVDNHRKNAEEHGKQLI